MDAANPKLPPPEFDLTAIVRKLLADNRLTAEDALSAILEGLMDNHKELRDRYRGRRMGMTLLQGVELLLAQEQEKNHQIHDRQVRDDEPDNTIYISGIMFGQLGDAQRVVCEILQRCMRELGCHPIREAA